MTRDSAEEVIYEGTWEVKGSELIFRIKKAGSREEGHYYVNERPFQMKVILEEINKDKMFLYLPEKEERIVLNNLPHLNYPRVRYYWSRAR